MTSYEYYKSGDQRIWRAGKEANPRREMRRTVAANGTLTERVAEKIGDPSPRRYRYDYDANRNLSEMVDVRSGDDRVTRLAHDADDRVLTVNERWENGKDTELRYDADGHITQRRTDGKVRVPTPDDDRTYEGGTRTRFTYDSRGAEQTAIVTRAGERARTVLSDWFPSGQRARRIRCNGELDPVDHPNAECGDEGTGTSLRATDHYFYRSDGRVISKMRDPREGPSDTEEYTYDDNGNRNRDERGTHTFNARNQLTSWTKAGRGKVRYEVNGTGAVTEKIDRGVRTEYVYVGDRMESSTIHDGGSNVTVNYCHSDFGNVTRITTAAANSCNGDPGSEDTTYTYDEFERMTESNEQGQAPTTVRVRRDRPPRLQDAQRDAHRLRLHRAVRGPLARDARRDVPGLRLRRERRALRLHVARRRRRPLLSLLRAGRQRVRHGPRGRRRRGRRQREVRVRPLRRDDQGRRRARRAVLRRGRHVRAGVRAALPLPGLLLRLGRQDVRHAGAGVPARHRPVPDQRPLRVIGRRLQPPVRPADPEPLRLRRRQPGEPGRVRRARLPARARRPEPGRDDPRAQQGSVRGPAEAPGGAGGGTPQGRQRPQGGGAGQEDPGELGDQQLRPGSRRRRRAPSRREPRSAPEAAPGAAQPGGHGCRSGRRGR